MDLMSLPTPSLVLDLARARRNARGMSELARAAGVRLRPHVKTHKCIELARLQTEGHFGGLTVSTLAEARRFGDAGFRDQVYAVPIDPGKATEAVALHTRGIRVAVVTTDLDTVEALDRAAAASAVVLPVYVEVDCGDGRTGLGPGDPDAARLAHRIAASAWLRFEGLLTHAGHSYAAREPGLRARLAAEERDAVVTLAAQLRTAGLEVPVVSVGSTPTVKAAVPLSGVTDVRPGNYLLSDLFQATLGTCDVDDIAVTVLAAVIDRSRARRAIVIDAGAIALSKDRGPVAWDADAGYGRVLDVEGRDLGLRVRNVSQEHGEVGGVPDALLDALPVDTRVRVLVNHSCLTVAQHEAFNVLEDGRLVDRWRIHRGWHAE